MTKTNKKATTKKATAKKKATTKKKAASTKGWVRMTEANITKAKKMRKAGSSWKDIGAALGTPWTKKIKKALGETPTPKKAAKGTPKKALTARAKTKTRRARRAA